MNKINQNKISIVIPILNFPKTLPKVLRAIENQTCRPEEIVIICSGDHQNFKNFLKNNKFKIPINISFVSKAFPGEARNIGAKLVKSPWVAFLDSKTIPNKNWLEAYLTFSFKENMDIILGCTRFISKNNTQLAYKYCSYGNINYETVPGTLIKTELVIKKIPFSNNYRYGEDILWRESLKNKSLKAYSPKEHIIKYIGLPSNYLETVKKYYFSSLNTYYNKETKLEIFMSAFLILYVTLMPRWNYLIDGWNKIYLFIPHIFKITTSSILALYVFYIIYRKKYNINHDSMLLYLLKYITLISLLSVALNWNDTFSNWNENHRMFFPHVTKIYISAIVSLSIVNRGLFIPIRKKVEYKKLMPVRWLYVGVLGASLDIVKLFGLLHRLVLRLKSLIFI